MKYKATRARSQLDELTFGTFNVRVAAAANGINGIGHIDILLRPCAAKRDVIGLPEAKRDRTSELVAFGYRVCFSGNCSGVKGRKGQHGVGLAIKENIVKEVGKDGIAIKCTSARRLKAQISI